MAYAGKSVRWLPIRSLGANGGFDDAPFGEL
jgi:hypothetical protein